MPVTLKAVDLLDRGGFVDGDILDDVLWDNGYGDMDDDAAEDAFPFEAAVLCECVRRHLAPLLIGFEIAYEVNTLHSPVRIYHDGGNEERGLREALKDVEVVLSDLDVLTVAAAVAAQRGTHPQIPPAL